jgi:erythromycin esterase
MHPVFRLLRTVTLVGIAGALACGTQMRHVAADPFIELSPSLNLDFELADAADDARPAAWRVAGDVDAIRLDRTASRRGRGSIRFDRQHPRKKRAGIANTVDALALRGHSVVFEGEFRRQGATTGGASLWLRVEGEFDDVLALESSASVSISNSGWHHVRAEVRVPEDALRLRFGIVVDGDGVTWGDALSLSATKLAVAKEARIAGVVRDAGSDGVAGANVALTTGTQIEARTVTDKEGRFRLSVPAGTYAISATDSRHTAWFAPPRNFSGARTVDIELEETSAEIVNGSISGMSSSTRDGFVTMWRISDDRGDVFAVPVNGGRFAARIPSGAQAIVVEYRHDGYLSWPVTVSHDSGPVQLDVFRAPPPDDQVIDDLRGAAIPIASVGDASAPMKSLERVVTNRAVVIGLGEPTHGTHDAFAAKSEIIEWLIRHPRWRTLAFEADVVVCRELNAYIHGDGMPLTELFEYFSDNIATKEVGELVNTLRAFNERNPGDTVTIIGLDELQPVFARGDIEEHLDAAGLDLWKAELAELQPLIDSATWGAEPLTEDGARAVSDAVARLRKSLTEHRDRLQSELGADRYRLIVDDVDYLSNSLRIVAARHGLAIASELGDGLRDSAMAARVLAHVEKTGPVIVWAHNAHIGRTDGGLGTALAEHLQDRYVAVGMSFAAGDFEAIDEELNQGMRRFHVDRLPWGDMLEPFVMANLPTVLVDLRSLPDGAARSWFQVPRLTREFGFAARRGDPSVRVTDVIRRFDWLVAFPTTRRALPFQRTLRDLP